MKTSIFAFIIAAALCANTVNAKEQSVTGRWTFTVEHVGLKLVLDQKDTTVSGTLDWPHGDQIKLRGQVAGRTLTFSGDSGGENFTLHIDSTGRLQADGTMTGVIKAHFVDLNDSHQVVRQRDQDISWTAVRADKR